jgi:hypothetical protein
MVRISALNLSSLRALALLRVDRIVPTGDHPGQVMGAESTADSDERLSLSAERHVGPPSPVPA